VTSFYLPRTDLGIAQEPLNDPDPTDVARFNVNLPSMDQSPPESPPRAPGAEVPTPLQIAQAIKQLSPEEAQFFIEKLEKKYRRRRLQAIGYGVALVTWLLSMILALFMFAGSDDGVFAGWVLIVPFALFGLVVYAFGRVTRDR
jgi:hypothetical protein